MGTQKKPDTEALLKSILKKLNDGVGENIDELQDATDDLEDYIKKILLNAGIAKNNDDFYENEEAESLLKELADSIIYIPAHYALAEEANEEALKKLTK